MLEFWIRLCCSETSVLAGVSSKKCVIYAAMTEVYKHQNRKPFTTFSTCAFCPMRCFSDEKVWFWSAHPARLFRALFPKHCSTWKLAERNLKVIISCSLASLKSFNKQWHLDVTLREALINMDLNYQMFFIAVPKGKQFEYQYRLCCLDDISLNAQAIQGEISSAGAPFVQLLANLISLKCWCPSTNTDGKDA